MQDNQLTRLSRYINSGFPCDKKNLLTDLHEFWNLREALSIKSGLINYGDKIIKVMCQYVHKQFYILSRPSKAVTQGKFQYTQKEVYILSRPMLPDCGTPPLQQMANYSIASPLQLITQCTPREKDLPQLPSTLGEEPEKSYIELTPGTPVWVQHRQYILGTNSRKPMYHKLLLDHAREWYRTGSCKRMVQNSQKCTGGPDLC